MRQKHLLTLFPASCLYGSIKQLRLKVSGGTVKTAGVIMLHGIECYGTLRMQQELPSGLNLSLRFQQALYELEKNGIETVRILADYYNDEIQLVQRKLHSITLEPVSLMRVLWWILTHREPAWKVKRNTLHDQGLGFIWCSNNGEMSLIRALYRGHDHHYREIDSVMCDTSREGAYVLETTVQSLQPRHPSAIVIFGPSNNDTSWRQRTAEIAKHTNTSAHYYKTPDLLQILLGL